MNLIQIESEKLWQILKSYHLVVNEIKIYQGMYDSFQEKIESIQKPSAVRFDKEKVTGTPTPKDTIVNALYSEQMEIENNLNDAKARKAAIEELCSLCSEEAQVFIEDKFFLGVKWYDMETKYHYNMGTIRNRIFSELEHIVAMKQYDHQTSVKKHLRQIMTGE